MTSAAALRIDALSVSYRRRGGVFAALRNVGFQVARGEAYGIVGESGCGKSTLALCVMRCLPENGFMSGTVRIGDRDVLALGPVELRHLRRTEVSMVYQDPARVLNPSLRTGEQIAEIFRMRGCTRAQARERTVAALKQVRMDPSVVDRYPHQLSGGMQQRVIIAMALSIEPRLLVLDEPTTGLDAAVAAGILELISDLRRATAMSVLFISHDLGVIARMCDRVGVLYAGELIEEGPVTEILEQPRHPYTVGLLRSMPQPSRTKYHGRLDALLGDPPTGEGYPPGCLFAPRCGLAQQACMTTAPPLHDLGKRRSRCHFHEQARETPRTTPADSGTEAIIGHAPDRTGTPVLRASGISKCYGHSRHRTVVLRDVTLELFSGETLGLVGESGSGKTTLARILIGLVAADSGCVELDGTVLASSSRGRRPLELKAIQIVFQNPDSALNRSHRVRLLIGRTIDRFVRLSRAARQMRVAELLRAVRLNARDLDRRPREMSGGMKQRTAIARAFAAEPRVIVCDEPTSALDVSVQASILNLLVDLQATRGVSYLYISHDLATVRYLSDRIAVLYRGRLMEIGLAERIFSGPHHPYTAALVAAVAHGVASAAPASGVIREGGRPSSVERGCAFHSVCSRKLGLLCEEEEPPLHPGIEPGHQIRCHIPAAELG